MGELIAFHTWISTHDYGPRLGPLAAERRDSATLAATILSA